MTRKLKLRSIFIEILWDAILARNRSFHFNSIYLVSLLEKKIGAPSPYEERPLAPSNLLKSYRMKQLQGTGASTSLKSIVSLLYLYLKMNGKEEKLILKLDIWVVLYTVSYNVFYQAFYRTFYRGFYRVF